MPIVSEIEVAQSLGLSKLGAGGLGISRGLMTWLRIRDLNAVYDIFQHLEGLEFIDAVLDYLQISVDISAADRKRLPKSGPFIVVANHPLGGIDGLILLKILLTYHPETKVMANFLLAKIRPVAKYICQVNPFETRKEAFSSLGGLREALAQLRAGHPLAIFPAGEVATRKNGWLGAVDDKNWSESVLKLIKKAKVAVVPFFFHAKNSELFYFLSGIHHNFRTASLASEVLKARHKTVKLRIGHPISLEEQEQFGDLAAYGQYLRRRTFVLGAALPKRGRARLRRLPLAPAAKAVAEAVAAERLAVAFEDMQDQEAHLFTAGKFQVFFTQLPFSSPILQELGQLRERTFRAVGEGTNKAFDLDKYDAYYHHLLLWNTEEKEIAGAYRLGLGQEIWEKHGIAGFYLSDLFHFKPSVYSRFKQGIEMGRALVTQDYQKKLLPLFLLWRGIGLVTERYPSYRYLIGAASISSAYSAYSQSLMLAYLEQAHADPALYGQAQGKRKFKSVLKKKDQSLLLGLGPEDLAKVDRMIQEIEPQGLQIPILIKKYLLQQAKVLGFNVDPAFNNAIDTLVCIEVGQLQNLKTDLMRR